MQTKNKIVKMASVCYVAAKVLYCLSFAVCLTFIALAIALPLTNAIDAYSPAETAVLFGTLAVYSFICIGLLWNVEGLFKSVAKEQTPFNEGVSHYLKKIAIFILILSIVPALLGSIVTRIVAPASELTFPIAFGGIIGGVVLLVIGIFFKYGNELQTKDDETL